MGGGGLRPVGGSESLEWWMTRLGRVDLVGPVVAFHVVGLAVLDAVARPVPVMAVAGGLVVWRAGLDVFAADLPPSSSSAGLATQQGRAVLILRGLGSLILMGVLLGLDGGTESPLFFSMLIVFTWETVISPLRRVVLLGVVALMVYAAVIVLVPDVTAKSLFRLVMFVAFIGLLAWARALTEQWQLSSARLRNVVTGVVETLPLGFAVYETGTRRCVLANETATHLGLDTPEETVFTPFGSDTEMTVMEVLDQVTSSPESPLPGLYVVPRGPADQSIIRVGVWLEPSTGAGDRLAVYTEDVTDQVTVGEQHRRFLQSANHQFRTPLAPILAYSEMIASGELSGDGLVEAADAIRDGALRIEHLLDRIGTLTRLQAGRYRPLVPVTVGELITTHLSGIRPDLVDGVRVEGDTGLLVRCEPRTLAMALGELVENGHRHGVPPVTIVVQTEDGRAQLRLTDQGPGPDIDPDTSLDVGWGVLSRPELMPSEMGTRLGLSYAHALAQIAGATLRFERNPDGWAFVVETPITTLGRLRTRRELVDR